ncbi:hypothetical protein M3Y99_00095500 [Aphelenchoides fujianensis]|nr:hypothetical protein M3Y99_00095500 [Aphelenchoides fujianensis]
MAMAEQQWSNNTWNNYRSENAVSNPIMVPQASPRSMGEQSGIFHQMVENVLNSPGSLNTRGDLKFVVNQKVDKSKPQPDQSGNNNNQTDHTTPVEGNSPTNGPPTGNEMIAPMPIPYPGQELQQGGMAPDYNQYPFVNYAQNPAMLYGAPGNGPAQFGTSPPNFYGLPRGTPPTSQLFSSSPPIFSMNFPGPGMVQGLAGAMSQMNLGGAQGMPPRRESFGSAGPTPINGGPVRPFPPQMAQQGYFVIPTSPPVSMGSSPSHHVLYAGMYPNASIAAAPSNGPHGQMNGPPNAVYGPMHPPRHVYNAPNGPHYSNGPVPPPHIPPMPPHSRRNGPLAHNGPPSSRGGHLHVMAADGGDKAVTRSPLLEEFRNSRLPQLQLTELVGHVAEFARDQHGSRFIQQKLERASMREKQMIFDEIIADAPTLMTDVFSNYVVQRFFEHGTADQKHQLVAAIKGDVLKLALHMYGCRILQKAIECVDADEQADLLKEIEGDVLKCVKDQNGNHVIQKIIERVDPNKLGFIIDAFTAEGPSTVTALSTHPYGCRVVQRILEHCTEEQKRPILEQLHKNIRTLIVDQYGNYVVQHVIERGSDEDRDRIINQIKGNLQKFSQHKFSSNVIEKCLTFGNAQQKSALIAEACGDGTKTTPLLEMMQHEFANFVVQTCLTVAESGDRKKIMLAIKPHIPTLRNSYGRHILTKLEKYFQQQNGSSPFAQSADFNGGGNFQAPY